MTDHFGIDPDGTMIEVHDEGRTGRIIDKVYVIVASDETGEGIIAIKTDNGWMPMIASDKQVIETYAEMAKSMAEVANQTTHILELSTRRIIRTIYEATEEKTA